MDGDGRGGAALSMRAATGKPVKLIGTGEKMDALEEFHPKRIADRILGHGATSFRWSKRPPRRSTRKKPRPWPRRWPRASSTSTISPTSCARCRRWGGMGGPDGHDAGAMSKAKDQMAAAGLDDKMFGRQLAIISSMTPKERAQAGTAQAFAQEAHRGGLGHQRRRDQQAFENAPPDGRHDEVHEGQEGRRHDGQADGWNGRKDGPCRAACPAAWAACPTPSQMSEKDLRKLQQQAEQLGLGAPGGPRPAACRALADRNCPGLGGPSLPGLPKGPKK